MLFQIYSSRVCAQCTAVEYTVKIYCMSRWKIEGTDSPCEIVYRFPFHGVKTWTPVLIAARGCGRPTIFAWSGLGAVIFLQYARQGNLNGYRSRTTRTA